MVQVKEILDCVKAGDLDAAKAKVNEIMDAKLSKLMKEGESFLAAGLMGAEVVECPAPGDEDA